MRNQKVEFGTHSDDVVWVKVGNKGDSFDGGEHRIRVSGVGPVVELHFVYEDGCWSTKTTLPPQATVEVYEEKLDEEGESFWPERWAWRRVT